MLFLYRHISPISAESLGSPEHSQVSAACCPKLRFMWCLSQLHVFVHFKSALKIIVLLNCIDVSRCL